MATTIWCQPTSALWPMSQTNEQQPHTSAEGMCSNGAIYSKTDAVIPATEEKQALSDDSIYSQIYSVGCLE